MEQCLSLCGKEALTLKGRVGLGVRRWEGTHSRKLKPNNAVWG